MVLPGKRWINLAGALACAAMMAYALYAQHQIGLEPCPLCVFQRVAVILLGISLLLAALHNPAGKWRFLYVATTFVSALLGVLVAGRHVWLQSLPPDQVPSCGPGLNYMLDTLPFGQVMQNVLRGSGECATVDWQFLGLSMPAWVLICVAILGLIGVWNNARRA